MLYIKQISMGEFLRVFKKKKNLELGKKGETLKK